MNSRILKDDPNGKKREKKAATIYKMPARNESLKLQLAGSE